MFICLLGVTGSRADLVTNLTCGLLDVSCQAQPVSPQYSYECSGRTCHFYDRTSAPPGDSYTTEWDFGDGTSSDEPSPTHTFPAYKTYTVGLSVTDASGSYSSPGEPIALHAPAVVKGKSGKVQTIVKYVVGPTIYVVRTPASPLKAPEPAPDHRTAAVTWEPAGASVPSRPAAPVAAAVAFALMLVAIFLLATRRIGARKAIEATTASEVELQRRTSEMIANVSHELRTPLVPLIGYPRLLEAHPVSRAQAREFAETMIAASDRLERVIDLMIGVAEFDAGKVAARHNAVCVETLLQEAVRSWSEREPSRTFFVGRVPDSIEIRGDQRLLALALDQLIDNAVKFSDAGPIQIEATASDDTVTLSVTDEGIGIAPKDQRAIFRDFHQADGSSTRTRGGLGLGLSLASRVARVHGGQIEVSSKPGAGSTFRLALHGARPLAAAV